MIQAMQLPFIDRIQKSEDKISKRAIRIRPVRGSDLVMVNLSGLACLLFIRFICAFIIGDEGMGTLFPSFELYCVFCGLFLVAPEKVISIRVREWRRRDLYQRIRRGIRRAGIGLLIAGILFAVLTAAGSGIVAKTFYHRREGYLSIILTALSLLFMCRQGLMAGFLFGMGKGKIVLHGALIRNLSVLILAPFFAWLFHARGLLLDGIWMTRHWAAAYGALGIMTGLTLAQFLSFLYLGLRFHLLRSVLLTTEDEDVDMPDGRMGVMGSFIPLALITCSFSILLLLGGAAYHFQADLLHPEQNNTASLGVFYGSILTPVLLFVILILMRYLRSAYQLATAIDQHEYDVARRFRNRFFPALLSTSLLFTMYGAALSGTLNRIFFSHGQEGQAGLGSACAYLLAALVLCLWHSIVLYRIHKQVALLWNLSAGAFVFLAALFVLQKAFHLGLHAFIFALLLGASIYAVFCMAELSLLLRAVMHPFRNLIFPVLCAAASGVVIFFMSQLMLPLIGEILTGIFCILVGGFLFFFLLLITGLMRESQMYELPAGRFLIALFQKIHILRTF